MFRMRYRSKIPPIARTTYSNFRSVSFASRVLNFFVLRTTSSLLLFWKYGFPTYLDAAAFFLASKQMPDLVFNLSRRCKSAFRIYVPHRPPPQFVKPDSEDFVFLSTIAYRYHAAAAREFGSNRINGPKTELPRHEKPARQRAKSAAIIRTTRSLAQLSSEWSASVSLGSGVQARETNTPRAGSILWGCSEDSASQGRRTQRRPRHVRHAERQRHPLAPRPQHQRQNRHSRALRFPTEKAPRIRRRHRHRIPRQNERPSLGARPQIKKAHERNRHPQTY